MCRKELVADSTAADNESVVGDEFIDDQCETYTVGLLHSLKSNHEEWVKTALDQSTPEGIKIRQIKENIPNHLVRLVTGRALLTILSDAHGYQFEHDEPKSEAEANLIASFLQDAQDYGELSADLDAGDRVQTA